MSADDDDHFGVFAVASFGKLFLGFSFFANRQSSRSQDKNFRLAVKNFFINSELKIKSALKRRAPYRHEASYHMLQ